MAFFSSAPAFMPSCQDFCSGICSVMMSPSRVGTGWWESASLARRRVSVRAQRQSEVHECVLGVAVLHTRRQGSPGLREGDSQCILACSSRACNREGRDRVYSFRWWPHCWTLSLRAAALVPLCCTYGHPLFGADRGQGLHEERVNVNFIRSKCALREARPETRYTSCKEHALKVGKASWRR